jgi:hypothetical protein
LTQRFSGGFSLIVLLELSWQTHLISQSLKINDLKFGASLLVEAVIY